jgi:CMP-N,N'-diacetyllegionaminic acid synthase
VEEVLAIIPARGGSKGVPRKNIRYLGGRPLIGWTIELALECPSINRVIVSTDDHEIAEISHRFGAETPFVQPHELASDHIQDFPVCQYALNYLDANQGYQPDIVVWLRPTAPLRRIIDVENVINLLKNSGADCVRSVSPVIHHPYWMKILKGDKLIPFMGDNLNERNFPQRQMLPSVYYLNGVVDATWAVNVTHYNFLFGGDMRAYIINDPVPDLDTEFDFVVAEALLNKWRSDDPSS